MDDKKKLSDENLQKVSGGATTDENTVSGNVMYTNLVGNVKKCAGAGNPVCPDNGGGAVYNVDNAEGGPEVPLDNDNALYRYAK